MTKTQGYRLSLVLGGIICVTLIIGLTLYALRQNINLFYTPHELLGMQHKPNTKIRVGGMVLAGTLQQSQNLQVKFEITDYKSNLKIEYSGILPDLFREGQGVVALGKLDQQGNFQAEQILAKHDENYMPPELSSKISKG